MVEAGNRDAADVVVVQCSGGRRLNKNYIGGAVEWNNSIKSVVSPLSLPLFEPPPPPTDLSSVDSLRGIPPGI